MAHFREPPALRDTLRTANPIERVFRGVRRRTKPVAVVNHDDSLERVAYSLFLPPTPSGRDAFEESLH